MSWKIFCYVILGVDWVWMLSELTCVCTDSLSDDVIHKSETFWSVLLASFWSLTSLNCWKKPSQAKSLHDTRNGEVIFWCCCMVCVGVWVSLILHSLMKNDVRFKHDVSSRLHSQLMSSQLANSLMVMTKSRRFWRGHTTLQIWNNFTCSKWIWAKRFRLSTIHIGFSYPTNSIL